MQYPKILIRTCMETASEHSTSEVELSPAEFSGIRTWSGLQTSVQSARLNRCGFIRSLAAGGAVGVVGLHEDGIMGAVAPAFPLQGFLDWADVCRQVSQLVKEAALADDAVHQVKVTWFLEEYKWNNSFMLLKTIHSTILQWAKKPFSLKNRWNLHRYWGESKLNWLELNNDCLWICLIFVVWNLHYWLLFSCLLLQSCFETIVWSAIDIKLTLKVRHYQYISAF